MSVVSRNLRRALLALAAHALTGTAQAAVFTVGADGACTHSDIDSALGAVPASGFHEVRIAIPSLNAQAVHITGRGVTVRGGYASCSAATSTGVTTLSGQGGAQDSVVTIRGSGNDVLLERLNLIRGDEVHDGYGGGLDFKGSGYVTLRDVAVSQNYAGYGGGISVIADGGSAQLRLEAGSVIQLNTAQFSGGGVRLEGDAYMSMLGINSIITGNEVIGIDPTNNQPLHGEGGGLQVIAPAIADIGSPGIGNGTIVANTARYGGGIAINATDRGVDGRVNLFTTDRAQPVRIYGNRATGAGGGIYAGAANNWPIGGLPYHSVGRLCALDTRIDSNIAPEGSAIYLDTDDFLTDYYGGQAYINREIFCPSHPTRARCGPGDTCNTIQGNRSEDAAGQATDGATITVQNDGVIDASQIEIAANTGAYVIHGFDDSYTYLDSVLIAGNTATTYLIRIEDDENVLFVRDSTLAGNSIGSDRVISMNGDFELARSIIWQPGVTSLVHSGSMVVESTLASEAGSLGGAPGAVVAFPRFVDMDRGDYRLRAASPAIDYVQQSGLNPWDVAGATRGMRLDIVPRAAGLVRDIGAYERQGVLPLALNGTFDADANLWPATSAGVAGWDGTQNAAGAAGSGSIKLSQAGTPNLQRVYGLSQCIHLPGPGIYALNGWGRAAAGGVGNRDYVYLNWEYRHAGGEQCDGGAPDASGDHFLSNSSAWQHPTNPKLIDVPAGEWTYTSSIRITQVVVEFGVTNPATTIGWFDGISLEPLLNDSIFKDGFEVP
jgi:hypothetical protein